MNECRKTMVSCCMSGENAKTIQMEKDHKSRQEGDVGTREIKRDERK